MLIQFGRLDHELKVDGWFAGLMACKQVSRNITCPACLRDDWTGPLSSSDFPSDDVRTGFQYKPAISVFSRLLYSAIGYYYPGLDLLFGTESFKGGSSKRRLI